MDVIKTMQPGEAGTKRYVEHFGKALVCVRYRKHPDKHERLTTVELIIGNGFYLPESNTLADSPERNVNRNVYLRIGYNEKALQSQVKQAGGKWQPQHKVWVIRYREARRLNLLERVVEINDVQM